MKKRVAVVILNYNGANMLHQFLPSVINNSPEADVIVADNASTDNSLQLLENEYPAVGVIKLDKNYGFAEGYNKALERLDYEYYILLNSDVEVTKEWIAPMLQFLGENSNVVACQPKLLDYKNKLSFEYAGASGGFIDVYGYPFCRGRIFNTVEEDKGQYNSIENVFWATGAALMVRSKEFWAVGGLDGRFFAHMEEVDLCWRLKSRGHQIVCVPQSVVYHVGGATLDRSNPHKTYLNFRNNLLMLYKNLPQAELARIMFIRNILDIVAATKFLLSGSFSEFRAVFKAHREFRRMKPQFHYDRLTNLSKTVVTSIPERVKSSILWSYYLKGIRTFDKLQK
ncbi:MAG: glycosyltransferase family 2 protein [Bacteroidaceae bacterium]|nr:glycosyltransferase family 2 protein [Bacteroidaceae bacterium]